VLFVLAFEWYFCIGGVFWSTNQPIPPLFL
jgi:hypothetical protein